MRIVILGGTRFIGRAVAAALVARGDAVLICHRGRTEPDDLPPVEHLHVDRAELHSVRDRIADFGPDAVVDVSGRNEDDAARALDAIPAGPALAAISSGDVYRAYEALHTGRQTDAVPLIENAPLRSDRFLDGPNNDNIGIERRYLARGGTVLRLSAVYGEYDNQRRFEFILRRVRGGRIRIPVGPGSFLFSRVYVGDVAAAVLAVLDRKVTGEVFNICERTTAPYRLFAQQILDIAGSKAELVTVPATALPADMDLTGEISQHLQMDPSKARAALGWRETASLERAVRWHIANPPQEWDRDFSADGAALAAAG
jgi:nucleoside-diphosphate-sugar epimerase